MSELLTLEQHGQVSVLTLNNGENRWTTTMVRELEKALDEVQATEGPHALVTASSDQKFFSNGLDLDWITSKGEHPGGDRRVFGDEAMKVFSRLITFPMPTIAAVNGHAVNGHDVGGGGFPWDTWPVGALQWPLTMQSLSGGTPPEGWVAYPSSDCKHTLWINPLNHRESMYTFDK